MAEGNGGRKDNLGFSGSAKKGGQNESEEENEDADENPLQPDIGLGTSGQRRFGRNGSLESSLGAGRGSGDGLRREDNPFSFKHFLSREGVGGARPKVYPSQTPPPSPSPPRILQNPEMTSGLPDFVQDHLVIEQCYLNSASSPQLSVDLEQIPDYSSGSPERNYPSGRGDIPFDLTATRRENRVNELPLDLPDRLPFDLPRSREPGQGVEVGASKSLPDFLSDGPIRSELRLDQLPSQPNTSPDSSPDFRHSSGGLHLENERLRRELDSLRRQLSDQIARSETLEAELCLARNRNQAELVIESTIEKLEDDVRAATKRALTAEAKAMKLQQENHYLKTEVEGWKNKKIWEAEGAASSSAPQTDQERLASQLRNAANTAELSLRHLLIGVDNLRLLAASLEARANLRTRRHSSGSDESHEDGAGPAL